jgi:hypothetical protein
MDLGIPCKDTFGELFCRCLCSCREYPDAFQGKTQLNVLQLEQIHNAFDLCHEALFATLHVPNRVRAYGSPLLRVNII